MSAQPDALFGAAANDSDSAETREWLDALSAVIAREGRERISAVLSEFGFTAGPEGRQAQQVGSLSGGWKMKLALARAMLQKADVLLLDEPTNHLDVENIRWLQDYLKSHTDITSLIVSHDSGFLDDVTTDIYHYEPGKKLGHFRGNLAVGGRGEGRPLTDRDRWIAAQVGPEMKRRGMVFVGLDVIGDWLTEVNVTSPTCIRELDAQYDLDIAGDLFAAIEAGG